MDNLTTFERTLLREFETLAAACERSGKVSADTADQLSKALDHFSGQTKKLRERQSALDERLTAVTEALDGQVRLTTNLIARVNALLNERGS